jgi:hypothetical protein
MVHENLVLGAHPEGTRPREADNLERVLSDRGYLAGQRPYRRLGQRGGAVAERDGQDGASGRWVGRAARRFGNCCSRSIRTAARFARTCAANLTTFHARAIVVQASVGVARSPPPAFRNRKLGPLLSVERTLRNSCELRTRFQFVTG